jgi:RNA polymerase sigma factor for flagellar operon FliA
VHNEFEFDEYFHFAVVGMLEALDRFDPGRGAKFTTFAPLRINGAILNGLDGLSERQQQIGLRKRLRRDRADSLGDPEASELAGGNVLQALGDIGVGMALAYLLEGTGMLVAPEDSLPDNAYAQIEMRDLGKRLWRLTEQLTHREAQVVRLHYLQEQPFEQVAAALGISRGRISQLHRQAIERLRALLKAANVDVLC